MTFDGQAGSRGELAQVLGQCTRHASQLKAKLEEERAAFADGDSTRLQALVEQKEQLVRQIEELESRRRDICNRLGFEADDSGMRRMLERAGDDGDLGGLWSKLLRCARDAAQSNRINGAIARARHDQTLAILAALHGATEAEPTYGERGRRTSRFKNNPLTSA